jgi:hypothetical protein
MIRRLAWGALLATIGAGLLGAVRQRREVEQVRRGARPRFSDGAVEPVPSSGLGGRSVGRLVGRLSTWVPEPPRTRPGRVAAAVWASPLTAIGLLMALASGRRPRWSDEHRCLLVDQVRGPSGVALRTVGAEANAIGQVVLSRAAESSPALLAHEAVHVRQAERLGPLLFPLYLWLGARYGYRAHPLEQAARLGARRAQRT